MKKIIASSFVALLASAPTAAFAGEHGPLKCEPKPIRVIVAGPTGPTGPVGVTEPTGPTGPTGATGVTGATGTAGTNGTNGTNGAQGPAAAASTTPSVVTQTIIETVAAPKYVYAQLDQQSRRKHKTGATYRFQSDTLEGTNVDLAVALWRHTKHGYVFLSSTTRAVVNGISAGYFVPRNDAIKVHLEESNGKRLSNSLTRLGK